MPVPLETAANDPLLGLGVRRFILGSADVDEATETLSRVFIEQEPLTRRLALSREAFHPFARGVCEAAVEHGVSVVARDRGGRLVGFRIAEPWPVPPAPGLAMPPGLDPILAILARLEEVFDRIHAADNRALHLQVMGCLPEYAGRGLATAMVRDTLDLAARRGIRRAFAEATNGGSGRVFERLGFSTLAEVPYATYEFERRRVFADVPETSCRLMVKDFAPAT